MGDQLGLLKGFVVNHVVRRVKKLVPSFSLPQAVRFNDALAKGDEVSTAGGFLGKVTQINDSFVGLEIARGVEIQLQRSAITQILPKGSVKTVS